VCCGGDGGGNVRQGDDRVEVVECAEAMGGSSGEFVPQPSTGHVLLRILFRTLRSDKTEKGHGIPHRARRPGRPVQRRCGSAPGMVSVL
jgi:hypothetical protein